MNKKIILFFAFLYCFNANSQNMSPDFNSVRGNVMARKKYQFKDEYDNLYLYGIYTDTLIVDGQKIIPLYTQGTFQKIFLAKYNNQHALEWIKQIGYGQANDIFMDYNSHEKCFYLTCSYGTITFDTFNLVGGNTLIAKFDMNADPLWVTNVISGEADAFDMTSDDNGNVYLTGWYLRSINLQSKSLSGNIDPNQVNSFIASYSRSGAVRWARKIYSGFRVISFSVISKNEMISISGINDNSNNGLSIDTINFSNVKGKSFVLEFDSNGVLLSSSFLGRYSYNFKHLICYDKDTNLICAGLNASNFIFKTDTLLKKDTGLYTYLVKLKNDSILQSTFFHTAGLNNYYPTSIVSDDDNNIYLLGIFSDTITIQNQVIPCSSSSSMLLLKFDKNFNFQSYLVGNANYKGSSSTSDLLLQNNHSLYITGYGYFDILNFGGLSLNGYTANDMYWIHISSYPTGIAVMNGDKPFAGLELFPNPTFDNVSVTLFGNSVQSGKLVVFDQQGKIIETYYVAANTNNYQLSSTNFSNGIYYVQWQCGNFRSSTRLIKQ